MFLARIPNLLKCCKNFQLPTRFYCGYSINSQAKILIEYLGLQNEEAVNYVVSNNLKEMEVHRVTAMLKFMKEKQYPKEEILKYPILFRHCNGRTWEHYYLYLEECGCTSITIKDMLMFRKLISLKISDLKMCELLPKDIVVADELIKHIKYLPQDFHIDDLKDDNLTLAFVHDTILKRFYISFFECSEDEILSMLRIHKGETKCFKYICENIDMAMSLGYSKKRIRGNAYILVKHPAYTKEVLEDIPNFAGGNMRASLRHYPKLIGISKQHILKVYDLIKEHDFSDEQVLLAMNVFTLSYNTVRNRLRALKKNPELKVLCYDRKILCLIIHFHRGNRRLELLNRHKLKCKGLHTIALMQRDLEQEINIIKDMNKVNEVCEFIKSILKTTDNNVVKRFRCHPFYLHVPFLEIKSTYKFLKKCNFNNEHLRLVPQILLYPKEKIKEVLELIYSKEYSSTGVVNCFGYQKLNIMLYLLEKNYHFTGNGIWANKTIPEELD